MIGTQIPVVNLTMPGFVGRLTVRRLSYIAQTGLRDTEG